jgi:hypothetical protein
MVNCSVRLLFVLLMHAVVILQALVLTLSATAWLQMEAVPKHVLRATPAMVVVSTPALLACSKVLH